MAATQLRVVPASLATARGAVCLDGSPPAYWYQPPRPQAATDNVSWLIHLDGGAWCYDELSHPGPNPSPSPHPSPNPRYYLATVSV